jgi:tRNA 2-selenouridine synthase
LLSFKINCLRSLHSSERIDGWHQLIQDAQWTTLVADLLESHYDPAYDRSMFKNYLHIADAKSVVLADITPSGFRAAAIQTIHSIG